MEDKFLKMLMRQRGRDWPISVILLFVTMFLLQPSLYALEPSKPGFKVEYIEDNLTINIKDVALGSLLGVLREKTGIEFTVGSEFSQKLVSFELGPLPLDVSLRRILSHFNHVLLSDHNNRINKVFILGYGSSENTSQQREVIQTQIVPRMPPPPSPETISIRPSPANRFSSENQIGRHPSPDATTVKPATGGGMVVSPYSPEAMVVKPSAEEGVMLTPSPDKMVISTSTDTIMVITPSLGTMSIKP